jgi:molecular chaperone DnaJ
MQRKDYYGILGVARGADENAIKMAYRRLALRNHPDTNRDDPQAEDRFKEISEAYEVLSSSAKKNRYDLGRDPLARPSFHPSAFDPRIDPFYESCFPGARCRGGGLGRVLGRNRRDFQGTGARPGPLSPHRSDHHVHDLALTPAEALKGTERDIRLHSGPGTLAFTVSIPAGVENGTLLSFKHQEIELQFRVRIA